MAMMKAPTSGVAVRMYRQGHGDCFLLAFPRRSRRKKRPVFMLIDCGLKSKSEPPDVSVEDVIDDIRDATDGYIDIAVVTHEHQDHVNGFAKKRGGKPLFDQIEFGYVWLAWTEDGADPTANALRERFDDTLLGLALAANRMGLAGAPDARAERVLDLLELEIGETPEIDAVAGDFRALRDGGGAGLGFSELAARSIKGITNKRAIKYLRDRIGRPPLFLRPERGPYFIPDVKGVNVYAFGPPRDVASLLDLDPRAHEEFHLKGASSLALDGAARSVFAALAEEGDANGGRSPFASRYARPADDVRNHPALPADPPAGTTKADYLASYFDPTSDWRAIDGDWLGAVEGLAIRLNNEVNNTSLVLAFELPNTGKTLLFTGDAQRGSWISWADLAWTDDDGRRVDARDLLSRCVFYKVGHHGSHNATLRGEASDAHPNLGWMAQGDFAEEFVAMAPANAEWAFNKSRPWRHPLPSIKQALLEKARGRVFQTDIDHVSRPSPDGDVPGLTDAEWRRFQRASKEERLYFEYIVRD